MAIAPTSQPDLPTASVVIVIILILLQCASGADILKNLSALALTETPTS